jgi:hypothetical protein
MAINMVVAMTYHFSKLDPWPVVAYPLQLFVVFFSLIFIGAGKLSLDYYLTHKSKITVKHEDAKHVEWPKKVEEEAAVHHEL